MDEHREAGRKFAVARSADLARVLRWCLDKGISRNPLHGAPTKGAISKLLHPATYRRKGVQGKTIRWIERFVGKRLQRGLSTNSFKQSPEIVEAAGVQRLLRSALLSHTASQVVLRSGYDAWIEERIDRFARKAPLAWLPHAARARRRGSRVETVHDLDTKDERLEVPGSMPFYGPEVLRKQDIDLSIKRVLKVCKKEVDDFVKSAERRGHEAERIRLSLVRMVEPLAESAESGCVERALLDLSEAELARFVKSSLAAEKILLARLPRILRAQQIAP